MVAVTDVTLTAGVPTSGTGTVTTLDKILKAASTGVPAAADPALAVTIRDVNVNGQATMANSAPIVPASNWEGSVALKNFGAGEYETVAAGVTSPQTLGASGAVGDYLAGVLVIPSTTSPSAVTIKDGSNTAITIFAGGATSVSNLVPFFIPLGLVCTATPGGWQLTTGASGASAIGIGNFT